ncbi:unnamed protein product [Prunus brigantina]
MDSEGMYLGSAMKDRKAIDTAIAAKTVFASSVVILSHSGKGPLFFSTCSSSRPPSPPPPPPPPSSPPPPRSETALVSSPESFKALQASFLKWVLLFAVFIEGVKWVLESGWRLRTVKLGILMGVEKWVWLKLGFWREDNGGETRRESISFSPFVSS